MLSNKSRGKILLRTYFITTPRYREVTWTRNNSCFADKDIAKVVEDETSKNTKLSIILNIQLHKCMIS